MALSKIDTTNMIEDVPQSKLDNNIHFKNYLINGNFDVWQRGTSHNITSSQYTVDRWQLIFDGTPATGGTVTRQTFALGQTDVPNNPKYYLQYDFPNVGTPSNYIRQSIEGVHNLAGQTATFSFWSKVPSGTMTISTQFQQEFGSGGSPSSGVYGIGSTNFTVTTTWQRFTMTTTLPSISGKTVGTNNNDKLNAAIVFPSNASGTIHLSQIQVEKGSTVSDFEFLPHDVNLRRCYRYCYKTPTGSLFHAYGEYCNAHHYTTTTMLGNCSVNPVEMRAPFSVTISGSFESYGASAVHSISSINANEITSRGFQINGTSSVARNNGEGVTIRNSNNTTAFILQEAEL